MIQVDHIYHFLFDNLYKDFINTHFHGGVPSTKEVVGFPDVVYYNKKEVTAEEHSQRTLFFYDQEPVFKKIMTNYDTWLDAIEPFPSLRWLVVSEKSEVVNQLSPDHIYYFFHGFAALDWFRGYYALNYNQPVVRDYRYDFISFNRIITGDRAYRKTFVDKLKENNLIEKGLISYGVIDDEEDNGDRLVIDHNQVSASASADILRTVVAVDAWNCPDYSAFWHIVTETVFYYDKLHLTEKTFKPIVSKQPFMLLAAPGNLAYLKSYGFKTFDSVIDESYDTIKDDNERINAVVAQMKWYCELSDNEKIEIQKKCEPIIEHNFNHFYGKFKEIITDELLDNSKKLFRTLDHDDSNIDYATVRKLLTS